MRCSRSPTSVSAPVSFASVVELVLHVRCRFLRGSAPTCIVLEVESGTWKPGVPDRNHHRLPRPVDMDRDTVRSCEPFQLPVQLKVSKIKEQWTTKGTAQVELTRCITSVRRCA